MIKAINESVNPYWFVTYNYDGDDLSDYQSTVLVRAKDEKSALARARQIVTKKEPSARAFQIRDDRKLGKSTTLSQFHKTYPFSNYDILIESIPNDMGTKITPLSDLQDISAITTDSVGKISKSGDFSGYGKNINLDDYKEPKINYSDPKYQKIVNYLNDNGYPGSKFLGKMGFYIPQDTSYVSIVSDDIFSECSIMTSRFRLNPASATEYQAELTKVIDVVENINAILADATNTGTKDRHISESTLYQMKVNDPDDKIKNLVTYIKDLAHSGHSFNVVVDPGDDSEKKFYIDGDGSDKIIEFEKMNESEIIESGNQNFGRPGTYIVYRNGEHQTKRGFISFSDTKAGADRYSKDGRETEKFAVTISNPYVSKGSSSYEAFANAHKDLVGTDPVIDPSMEKINNAWRKYDSEIANKLADKGYDSLIYIVPQNNEVNVLGADIDKMPNINEYNESVPQALGTE